MKFPVISPIILFALSSNVLRQTALAHPVGSDVQILAARIGQASTDLFARVVAEEPVAAEPVAEEPTTTGDDEGTSGSSSSGGGFLKGIASDIKGIFGGKKTTAAAEPTETPAEATETQAKATTTEEPTSTAALSTTTAAPTTTTQEESTSATSTSETTTASSSETTTTTSSSSSTSSASKTSTTGEPTVGTDSPSCPVSTSTAAEEEETSKTSTGKTGTTTEPEEKPAPVKAAPVKVAPVVEERHSSSKKRLAVNNSTGFYRRTFNANQFVGFHGTQSINAALFQDSGISKPQLGSGANAELGLGLYVADDLTSAKAFANNAVNNVKKFQGLASTPKVCMIFAKDAVVWTALPKIWYPAFDQNGAKLIKDDVNNPVFRNLFEQNRKNFAQNNGMPSVAAQAGAFVRFAPLDVNRPDILDQNQFSIPESLQPLIGAECLDPTDPALATHAINYRTQIIPWAIIQGCGVTTVPPNPPVVSTTDPTLDAISQE